MKLPGGDVPASPGAPADAGAAAAALAPETVAEYVCRAAFECLLTVVNAAETRAAAAAPRSSAAASATAAAAVAPPPTVTVVLVSASPRLAAAVRRLPKYGVQVRWAHSVRAVHFVL